MILSLSAAEGDFRLSCCDWTHLRIGFAVVLTVHRPQKSNCKHSRDFSNRDRFVASRVPLDGTPSSLRTGISLLLPQFATLVALRPEIQLAALQLERADQTW
jgi:hypothetical protein